MLECVINISEGSNHDTLAALKASCHTALLDVHTDPDHNRSVFTLCGTPDETMAAAQHLARSAVARISITNHRGVHPRIGVVDVVPFVPLTMNGISTSWEEARSARDDFASWIAGELGVPVFLYGNDQSLPDIRHNAFVGIMPDHGALAPHLSAGAVAVGVRNPLVAFNVWLDCRDLNAARAIASEVRGPTVRALGMDVGGHAQVSVNLISPETTGPLDLFSMVREHAEPRGISIHRCELVGLLPATVLHAQPSDKWSVLDLSETKTIESRYANLHSSGMDGTEHRTLFPNDNGAREEN